jgi:serine protease Do
MLFSSFISPFIQRRFPGARRAVHCGYAAVLGLSLGSPAVALTAVTETRPVPTRLAREEFKSGEQTLRAFMPVSRMNHDSVVKVECDGKTVALAAVIDATGLGVTKASEVKEGKLSCWLPSGKTAAVELLNIDEDTDLALIRIHARGLKPIAWTFGEVKVGQWVVTPGTAETPQAVGIVSVPTRKIFPPRALIGVQLAPRGSSARIAQLMSGYGAEKAGLKPGDVIVAVNDSPLKEGENLSDRLREFRQGQTVKLRVQRESEEFEAVVDLRVPPREPTGRGMDRADRMDRMGSEPSERAEGFERAIQHDTVLQAWHCGGPLLDLDGKAVGLNIARAGRVASYALPADLVRQTIQRLTAAKRAAAAKL